MDGASPRVRLRYARPTMNRLARATVAMSLLAGALAFGCAPEHAPRAPVQGGGLAVGAEASEDTGPFRVVFASPQGPLAALPKEITVVFSRPMRPLDASPPALRATVTRGGDAAPLGGK